MGTRANAFLFGAILLSAGCHTEAEVRPLPVVRLMGAVAGGGTQWLDALAGEYSRTLPKLEFELVQSTGSVGTVEAIQRGDAEFGITLADVAYLAFSGRLEDRPESFSRLRGISVLNLYPLHFLVGTDSGIRDVADLRGRAVATGPLNGRTRVIVGILLNAFGIELEAIHPETLPSDEAATKLIDGRLDAMFVMSSGPADAVYAAMKAGARLLPLQGPVIEHLRHDYPFVRLAQIPDGVYPGQMGMTRTIGVDGLLVCRSDLDESLVYDLTKQFFDILPLLSSSHPFLRLMDLDQAPGTPIPLHAGAARYYREQELFK